MTRYMVDCWRQGNPSQRDTFYRDSPAAVECAIRRHRRQHRHYVYAVTRLDYNGNRWISHTLQKV